MLVKIEFDDMKEKLWNNHLIFMIQEYKDDEDMVKYCKSQMILIDQNNHFTPLSECDLEEQGNAPTGFYVDSLNSEKNIKDLTIFKIKENNYSFSPKNLDDYKNFDVENIRNNYGVCDNYKQILKEYPELEKDKDKKFIVLMSPIFKEHQSKEGGWRWHKWGKYIGDYKPKYEYLYDEDIDMIWLYDIIEVEEDI